MIIVKRIVKEGAEEVKVYRRSVLCECGKSCSFTGSEAASVDRDVNNWEDDHGCTWLPRSRAVPA